MNTLGRSEREELRKLQKEHSKTLQGAIKSKVKVLKRELDELNTRYTKETCLYQTEILHSRWNGS